MRFALLALALLAACGDRAPVPDVVGTLIVEPPAGRDSDAYIATEAEVLRSQTLRTALKERQQIDLAADALVVTPRPGTRVIEVGVRDPDKQRAAQVCNALMRTYVEYRMERVLMPMLVEEKALAEQLEQHSRTRSCASA